MSHPHGSSFSPTKLVLGLAVLGLGIILLGDGQGWLDGWRIAQAWPVLPAAFGLARLVQNGPLSPRGHLLLGLAAFGFLQQFAAPALLERVWPAFVVYGGIILTLRALFPRRPAPPNPSPDAPSAPDSTQVTP